MINLDFGIAIAGYLLVFLIIVLAAWLLDKQEQGRDMPLDPKLIWFCSVCTYNYVDTKQEKVSLCPRCGSYNKK